MKFSVVSSMNLEYNRLVGQRMIQSYSKHWPAEIPLTVYAEDASSWTSNPLYSLKDLHQCEPTLVDFINRNSGRPGQHNPLAMELGAIRFSYKTYSILNAAQNCESDYLIWLDADTYTYADIPIEFLNSLVDSKTFLVYLGRNNTNSECGFVIYNMKHADTADFFATWRDLYETDKLFDLEQWHDSYVFDSIRLQFERQRGTINRNLTPSGKDYDHVFINSELGKYIDHMKGPRKNEGKSRSTDIYTDRKESYWTVDFWKDRQ